MAEQLTYQTTGRHGDVRVRRSREADHASSSGRRGFHRRYQLEALEERNLLTAADLLEPSAAWASFEGPSNSFWQAVDEMPAASPAAQTSIQATRFEPFTLDATALRAVLANAPLEFTSQATLAAPVIGLPTPDGGVARFTVVESPIMEPGLAVKFPEIKTYAGRGIDDPAASVRFDFSPTGFHAQVLSPNGGYNVEPYWHLDTSLYASYFHADQLFDPKELFEEELGGGLDLFHKNDAFATPSAQAPAGGEVGAMANGDELRTYRMAVAATGDFTAALGGTTAAQAAIVTAVNGLNGIFQNEASIRFNLVANNNLLIYTNSATDPYTDGSGRSCTMRSENQTTIDSVIGNANYDIGHVLGTGGGGCAALGVVGTTGLKAFGVSLTTNTIVIAHEVGHQFNANHTFNGLNGSCGLLGQYAASAAYEPGSGTTIMSYAGACGVDDVQLLRNAYYHSKSLESIIDYSQTGDGNAAAVITPSGNNVPVVLAGLDRTIPAATAFALDISASGDTDLGDTLTYTWEQVDLGPGTAQPLATPDDGSSPLFRSWPPTTDSSRTFPQLSNLLNGTLPPGEQLPTTNRDLNFRVTVRDGRGGVDWDERVVTVVDTGTPFRVTSPNTSTTWTGGTTRTVSWNVAGTTAAPIDADFVNIRMSLDGGNTFPVLLVTGTSNDGSQTITVPNVNTSSARIKIEAAGNVFFDISDANFTIESAPVEFELLGISSSGIIYDVDQVSGVATNPDGIGANATVGIALNPGDGMLYTLTSSQNSIGSPNSLYRIDPTTGATTLVGPTGLPNGLLEGDLDFDPFSGKLYGLYTGGPIGSPARELFTVDIETGVATIVAPVDWPADMSAMAFTSSGTLYVLDNGVGSIFRVNKTTGAISSQVTLSAGLGGSAGMDFHPETGTLYVADGGGAGAANSLFTLNPTSGVLTPIGPTGLANGLAGLEFIGPGEIHGIKWHDQDGDGVRDTGDPGLHGWTIYLDMNDNNQYDASLLEPDHYPASTLLNTILPGATLSAAGTGLNADVRSEPDDFASSGAHVFSNEISNLWEDSRRLRIDFVEPVARIAIDFVSNDSSDVGRLEIYDSSDQLLGTYLTRSLATGEAETMTLVRPRADIAYAIANGDGSQEGLLDNLLFGEPSTTTGSDGEYSFADLPPGPYTVAEVQQPGWEQVYPTGDGTHAVSLAAGVSATKNFGNKLAPGEIRGRKWQDNNADGLLDSGERGLAGWQVFLDSNDNGILDPVTTSIRPGPAAVLPDTGGITIPLFVSGLVGPIVDLNVAVRIGHTFGFPLDAYLVSPAGTTVDLFSPGHLPGGNSNLSYNDEGTDAEGRLSAFDGEDPNGLWQLVIVDIASDGQIGVVSGWSLELQHGERSATTNAAGDYRFRDVKPGTYVVVEVQQDGWAQTYPVLSGSHTVEVAPGATATADFGNRYRSGEIRGTKFDDLNGNGSRDAGEQGLPGWEIYLDGNDNGVLDAIAMTTVPGSPAVMPNAGTIDVPLFVGGLTGPIVDLNVNLTFFHSIGLLDAYLVSPAGTRVELFSYGRYTSFSGTLDDEGVLAEGLLWEFDGESPNGIWHLVLNDPYSDSYVGQLIAWSLGLTHGEQIAVTDANGSYAFAALKPAGYTVAEVPQPDWEQTYPGDPGVHTVLLDPDETVTADFGNRQLLLPGDLDRDGDTDFDDIDDFVLGLNDPAGYEALYGISPDILGDMDMDGDLDFDDIDDFVATLNAGLSAGRSTTVEDGDRTGSSLAVAARGGAHSSEDLRSRDRYFETVLEPGELFLTDRAATAAGRPLSRKNPRR